MPDVINVNDITGEHAAIIQEFLINHHAIWRTLPAFRGSQVFRRRLVLPTTFLYDRFRGDGCPLAEPERVPIRQDEIMSVQRLHWNGNIIVRMFDDRKFWTEAGTWAVECYSPTGELVVTIRG